MRGLWVWYLVREIRSHMLCSAVKKKKNQLGIMLRAQPLKPRFHFFFESCLLWGWMDLFMVFSVMFPGCFPSQMSHHRLSWRNWEWSFALSCCELVSLWRKRKSYYLSSSSGVSGTLSHWILTAALKSRHWYREKHFKSLSHHVPLDQRSSARPDFLI